MPSPTLCVDIAIIGGGIAGLWALCSLRRRGYSAVLFESRALGAGQTIACQGIVHGGVKFALDGRPGSAGAAASGMPDAWRRCLAGEGEIDLRGCAVLSECMHLFSPDALPARLSAALAERACGFALEAPEDFPAPLRHADFGGTVYRLAEPVLDVASLLAVLAEAGRGAIFRIDWRRAALERTGGSARLRLPGCTLAPGCLLLAAGAGNEALLGALGADVPMQRRALQQVIVTHAMPEPFFAHCLGAGAAPRLSVTSHRDAAGRPVWYLGGELADHGAREDPARLVARARAELGALLPWVDLGGARWRTLRLERAEARRPDGARPDDASLCAVPGVDNAFAAWPTKLALCPRLGETLLRALRARGIAPRHAPDLAPLAALGRPGIATAPWAADPA